MEGRRLVEWEAQLKALFDEVDDHLEDTYGPLYSLHPSRPRRGRTANKEQDGLFNVGASFSPGFGSRYGRGYVVDIDVVTLEAVPDEIREMIERDVQLLVERKLPKYFPGRKMYVARDGSLLKIFGDLSFRGPSGGRNRRVRRS